MTNQEAQILIDESERKLRKSYFVSPLTGWVLTALSGISGWLTLPYVWGNLVLVAAFVIGLWSVYTTEGNWSELRNLNNWKSLYLWRAVSRNKTLGLPIEGLALEVRDIIKEIYSTGSGESLLPLSQAVRLFDVYVRQQKRLNLVNARLRQLHALRKPLMAKSAQLEALGKDYVKSPQERQLDDEIERVKNVLFRIETSCTRLEGIVERLSREAQARQIQLELNDLSARLPHAATSEQPIFASESLEDIERQIGREIETYLQLERETDEHLR